MFVADCFSINDEGHLTIGGADTVELAERFGTPLYVMDEGTIRNTLRDFNSSMNSFYGGCGDVAYASKAFSCKEIYRIAKDEGCHVDLVSMGELYTALKAGFPLKKAFYHGNNKTVTELSFAIEHNIGRIVVDNMEEFDIISSIATSQGKTVDILLRIKPGVDAHTHDFIRTGQIDSKFGFILENGEAMIAVEKALESANLNLRGIHCHIGSQIFDVDPFELAAKVMMEFMIDTRAATGHTLTELNLGGGFGIMYTDDDNPVPVINYMDRVSKVIYKMCEEHSFELPRIIIEPGRSVVGAAGITLYTVGGIKNIPNIRTYVSIDGGMADNPRYIMYNARYDAVVASRAGNPKDTLITLAGRCCESGDLIGENMPLQSPKIGDTIAVFSTGAYNYAMSSNYNRTQKPAVVMIKDKTPRIIVKRESLDDLICNDM